MKLRNYILPLAFVILSSCSTLKDFALDAMLPDSGGGIDTEIVVGDKEQVLGTNQDVKANNIEKVIGKNDNSTKVAEAKEVTVNNTNGLSDTMITVLIVLLIAAVCAPTPTTLFNYFFRRNKNED